MVLCLYVVQAASAAFAQDVSTGLAKAGSSSSPIASSSTAAATKTAAPKPSNPFANYSTAESLGFTDPDAERAKAEAERKRTQGVAGEWQVVEIVQPKEPEDGEDGEGEKPGEPSTEPQTGQKRAADAPADDEDARAWKLSRKTASIGLGELYDPLAVPIKLKPKKEAVTEGVVQAAALDGSEMPKWSARGWNKPGASSTANSSGQADGHEAKVEEDGVMAEEHGPIGEVVPEHDSQILLESKSEVKNEPLSSVAPLPPPPTGGSLFKKRKAPAGGGSRGGRRL